MAKQNTGSHWDALLLFGGALRGAFRHQLLDWRRSIRWPLRFVLMLVCSLIALLPTELFRQLPDGWPEILLDNIGDPRALFIAFFLLCLFAFAATYGLAARKLRNSL